LFVLVDLFRHFLKGEALMKLDESEYGKLFGLRSQFLLT